MTERSIIRLLRSGNFTVFGEDSDRLDLYKGHVKYNELVDEEGEYTAEGVDYGDDGIGYVPGLTVLLIKALGGKVDSI